MKHGVKTTKRIRHRLLGQRVGHPLAVDDLRNTMKQRPALLPTPNTPMRRSLEKRSHDEGIQPSFVAEFDDPAMTKVVATPGTRLFPVPTVVLQESVTRYGVRLIGTAEACRSQIYAITAEKTVRSSGGNHHHPAGTIVAVPQVK